MPNVVVMIEGDHWSVYSRATGINDGTYEFHSDPTLFYTDAIDIEGICVYWATGGADTVTIDVNINPGPSEKIIHHLDYYTTTNPATCKSYYPLGIRLKTEDTTNICYLTIQTNATNTVDISAWGRLVGARIKEVAAPVAVKQIDVWPFKRG